MGPGTQFPRKKKEGRKKKEKRKNGPKGEWDSKSF